MDKIHLLFPKKIGTVRPEIYGVFAEHIGGCIYDGIYCGKDSPAENIDGFRTFIIEHLRKIGTKVIRWPGGCFAETYDWRDGIGPREKRPVRRNWWTNFDNRYETNEVGTDEFMRFCELCDADAYFAANITSTTPLDIRDWMDYCLSPENTTTLAKLRAENGHPAPYKIPYWGVGNETWGGGGDMTPEQYAHAYRRYAALMHNMDPKAQLIGSGANNNDYNWTLDFLRVFRTGTVRKMNGLAFHYYCGKSGDCVDFTTEQWYDLLTKASKMEERVVRHYAYAEAMGFTKEAALVIDEWGAWHPDGSGPSKGYNLFEQQSTMRDAMISAITLNIFNNHCEKIKLCAVAQLVNNLHALFLAGGEYCITTPTYHVFDLFHAHHNKNAVQTVCDCPTVGEENLPMLSVSASEKDGRAVVTVANLSAEEARTVQLIPAASRLGCKADIRLLHHDDIHAHNTFEQPDNVKPVDYTIEHFDGIVEVPAGSVMALEFDLEDIAF